MNQQFQTQCVPNIDIPANPFKKNKRFIGIQKSLTPTNLVSQNVQVEIGKPQSYFQEQNYILYNQIQGQQNRANSSLVIMNAPQDNSLFNNGNSENSIAVGTPVTTPRQQNANQHQQNNNQMKQLTLSSKEQEYLKKQQELMNIKSLIQQGNLQINLRPNGQLVNYNIESIINSKETLIDETYKQKIQNLIQNVEDSSQENTSQGLENLIVCLETANEDNLCNHSEQQEEKTVIKKHLDFSKKNFMNMDINQSSQNPLSRDSMSPFTQNSINPIIQNSLNSLNQNQNNIILSQNAYNPMNQYSKSKMTQDSMNTISHNQINPQIFNSIQKINDKNNRQNQNEEYSYTIKKNIRSGSTDVCNSYSQQSSASINFYSPRVIKATPKKEELHANPTQNDLQMKNNYIFQFIDPNGLTQNMNANNILQQSNVHQDNTQFNKINVQNIDKNIVAAYSSNQTSPIAQSPFGIKIANGINTIERQEKDKQFVSVNNELHLSGRNTSRVMANNISISGSVNNYKQQVNMNEMVSQQNYINLYPYTSANIQSQQQTIQQTAKFNMPQFQIAPRIQLSRQMSSNSITNTPKNINPLNQNQNQLEIKNINFVSNQLIPSQSFTTNAIQQENIQGTYNNTNQFQNQIPQINQDLQKRKSYSDENTQQINGTQVRNNFQQSIGNNKIASTFERGKSETRINYPSEQLIPSPRVELSNLQLNNQERSKIDDYLKQIVSPETMKILEEQREMKKDFPKLNSQNNLCSPKTNNGNLKSSITNPQEILVQGSVFNQNNSSVYLQSPLKQQINPTQIIQDSFINVQQNYQNQPLSLNQWSQQNPQITQQQQLQSQQVNRPKILSSHQFQQKQQTSSNVAGLSLLSVQGREQLQINTIQGVGLLYQPQYSSQQQDLQSFVKVQNLLNDYQKPNTDRIYYNQQQGFDNNNKNQQREKANSLHYSQIQNNVQLVSGSTSSPPLQYKSILYQNQEQNNQIIQQVNQQYPIVNQQYPIVNQQYPIVNQQNQEEIFSIASFNNQSYQSRDLHIQNQPQSPNNSYQNLLQIEEKQKQTDINIQPIPIIQHQFIENQRETFDCNISNQNNIQSRFEQSNVESQKNKRLSNFEIESHLNYKSNQFINQYIYDVTEKPFTPEKLNAETPTNYNENIDEFNEQSKKVNKISPPQSYSPCFNKQQTQSSPNRMSTVLQSFGVHPTAFQQTFQQEKLSDFQNENIQQSDQNEENNEASQSSSYQEINSPNKLQDGSQYYVQSNFTNLMQLNSQNQQKVIKNYQSQPPFELNNNSNASESQNMLNQGNEAVKRAYINKSQNSYQSNQDNSLKQTVQSKKIQSKNDSQQEDYQHLTTESIEVDLLEKNPNLIYESKQDLTPTLKKKNITALQSVSGNGFKNPSNQEKVRGINNFSLHTSDRKQRQNQYSKNIQQINNKQRSAISAHRSSKPEDILQEQFRDLQKQTKQMIEKSQQKIKSCSQERSSLQTKQIKGDGGKSPLSFEIQMKQILQSQNGVNKNQKGSTTASSRNYNANSSHSKESQGLIPKSEITMRKIDQSNIISIINSSNVSNRNSLQDISPIRQNQVRPKNDKNMSSQNSINLKLNSNIISQSNIDKNLSSFINQSNIAESKLDLSKTKIQAASQLNHINGNNNYFPQNSNITQILSKANLIDQNCYRPLTNSSKFNNQQSNLYQINNNNHNTNINQKPDSQSFETDRNKKINEYQQNKYMGQQNFNSTPLNMQNNGKTNISENTTIQATVNNAFKGIDKSKVACQWQTRSQIKNLLKMKSDTFFSQQNSTKNQHVNDKKMNFKQ